MKDFFDAESPRRVSTNNGHDDPNHTNKRSVNSRAPNTNVENEESKSSVVQDTDPSANGGSSSTSIQNRFLGNIIKRTIAQKLKDNCDADNFKNLSMFKEDYYDCESSSFNEDSSVESRSESELDDGSNEPQRKISVKKDSI